MRGSFFKVFFAVFIATLGFLGLQQSAHAQATAPSCFDSCFNLNANNTDLLCCGQHCDARTYCDQVCLCGDGQIEAVCDVLEQCDDGNRTDGDGCSSTCHLTDVVPDNCGNGILDDDCGNPEECDDGNNINGDGCDANCVTEPARPGTTAPGVTSVNYRGAIDTTDLVHLRDTVNKDLNIKPHDFVVAAVSGVSFAANPGPANLKVTVMPKLTAALNLLLRGLFGWMPETTSVPMSLNIGCIYPKNFCFPVANPDGTTTNSCAKGCQETVKTAWGTGATACPTNIGCCNDPTGCTVGDAFLEDSDPSNDILHNRKGDGRY